METKSLKQTVTLPGTPAQVYDLLMDAKQHAEFTGGAVEMDPKPKGKFNIFDGYIHGHNIELKKGEKIKQAWHFAEDGWPDDHFSICTFILEATADGTKLTFTQTGVPAHKIDSLKSGWKEYYWEPMKNYLKK